MGCATTEVLQLSLCLLITELGSKFVDEGIAVLAGGIAIYADLFKRTKSEDTMALELSIAKSHRGIKEVASELLDLEDEWNNFLSEIEGKGEENGNQHSTLVVVGDAIQKNFFLQLVTLPPHTAMASDEGAYKTSSTVTLQDILKSSRQNATLFVFNRHFA